MNINHINKKTKTSEKYSEEELHYYSELYSLRTTKTSILLGEYSTETQLIFTPKAIYDEYHYILVKKQILRITFLEHNDYIKTFYKEKHLQDLILQILQFYQKFKQVHLITEKIITLQEKLIKINTKPNHYSVDEQIRRKLQQLKGLLLKELEYIFYNIISTKLAKEKISEPNEVYNWITVNNYEYQGYYNQLLAHSTIDYNSEENHRQHTFNLIDQYIQNRKSINNQIIASKQEYSYETFERIAERETLEETGILIYQEKLIEIGHNTNGNNTENATEIKTYIYPANNQDPLQMELNNHGIWKYYTKAEILDHIIITPELQLQLNLIFYSIEHYQKILDFKYKEEEVDSENEEQFEKLELPNFTLNEATDFINKSFENIQPVEVYQVKKTIRSIEKQIYQLKETQKKLNLKLKKYYQRRFTTIFRSSQRPQVLQNLGNGPTLSRLHKSEIRSISTD
ncbi:12862_t:CDS:2 [Racocetra persica]|uniref:12862_t:CDS:1 n=1 Tax=Racocetra persica TaxID=160502 RepID=A0ACA9PGX3_9GLOM|nr:12862_t:CDS:2 [Racocetra persica]